MIIQILADDRDFEDFYLASNALIQSLQSWLESINENERVTLIDQREPKVNDIDDYDPFNPPSWKIGLQIDTQKKRALKGPLSHLYKIAKANKLDFSINLIQDNRLQPVSYFGVFEGPIDLNDLAWQLKLK